MKKIISIVVAALLIVGLVVLLILPGLKKDNNPVVDPEVPFVDDTNRYIVIINDTGKVLNEVHLYLGDGTEIKSMINPDETSFTIKIDNSYSDITEFKVKFVDNYDRWYEKTETNVPSYGRTTINVKNDDYIKRKGDIWRNINELFNELFK